MPCYAGKLESADTVLSPEPLPVAQQHVGRVRGRIDDGPVMCDVFLIGVIEGIEGISRGKLIGSATGLYRPALAEISIWLRGGIHYGRMEGKDQVHVLSGEIRNRRLEACRTADSGISQFGERRFIPRAFALSPALNDHVMNRRLPCGLGQLGQLAICPIYGVVIFFQSIGCKTDSLVKVRYPVRSVLLPIPFPMA